MELLPVLLCRKAPFAAVVADASAAPWLHLEPQVLRLVVDGTKPEQSTSIRAGWESDRLRLLFTVEDNDPWATLTERDALLYTEEVVEVFLDTEGDGEGYFEIEVNPNNAVLDCCARKIRSGYRKDFRWRCEGLETAVQMVPGGWVVELAIPFASLTSRMPQSGEQWRVNFTRIDRPKGKERELSAWSPTGLAQFHVPQRFGFLRFE
ncbi:MAG: carbohydrate-binding family 9-like protein [Verrucomicrobiota bacterium]